MALHIIANTADPDSLLPSTHTESESGRQQQAHLNSHLEFWVRGLAHRLCNNATFGQHSQHYTENVLPPSARPKNDRPAVDEDQCNCLVGRLNVNEL